MTYNRVFDNNEYKGISSANKNELSMVVHACSPSVGKAGS